MTIPSSVVFVRNTVWMMAKRDDVIIITFLPLLSHKEAMRTTESAVTEVGMGMVSYNCRTPRQSVVTHHFKRSFGCSPYIVKKTWNLLFKQRLLPAKGKIKHLLWCLAFLKSYCHESVYQNWFKAHPNTLRKWMWKFISALSRLKVVSTILVCWLPFYVYSLMTNPSLYLLA